MKSNILFLVVLILSGTSLRVTGQELNGKIDDLTELTTILEVPFTMPDGTRLMTDIHLPVTKDSMVVDFDIPGFGTVSLEVIPRGVQYIIYDSVNGQPNAHPYQLPMIFARTPYGKTSETEIEEAVFTLMGYGYILQDMRGRNKSEGAYLPMYSDSWSKNPYHPDRGHANDITELSSEMNGNRHEDGYNSIQFINDSLYRIYQQDTFLVSNGSVGMVGYSALGNSQYQAASAYRIDPKEKGLKCLYPIVSTNENYHSTGFHNGVYRQALVERWMTGQMESLNENQTQNDQSILNSLHTPADFGLQTIEEVTRAGIDYFTSYSENGQVPAYYPNSILRNDMDASQAPVNELGIGDKNGKYSRYGNLEVPIYHLSGWWDIYTNGQVDTYNLLMKNLSSEHGNKSLQKLVIGPWAHQTIGKRTTGDITYKENINDFIVPTDKVVNNRGELALDKVINSDVVSWFRSNLNHGSIDIGEPKVLIPQSNKWQLLGNDMYVRIPSSDCKFSVPDFINYLSGHSGLPKIDVELRVNENVTPLQFEIPKFDAPILTTEKPLVLDDPIDFRTVPNVRLYVPGPINDGVVENEMVGNYWLEKDSFPFKNDILPTKLFMHNNGMIKDAPAENEEASLSYLSDPDNPVLTTGGGNMLIDNPNGSGKSFGQKNLANSAYIKHTLDHEGVIQFETDAITDSISIVGVPIATLFASCSPEDSTIKLTDTDFFIRILDVYPDGGEYFVVEGAVNARAREYAKKLVTGIDAIDTPFENIRINRMYEYNFKMLPIAYTFGKGHKIKVLISSSNYPRYQVNANVPVNTNEFTRREPNDGQTFYFEGKEMQARKVIHTIALSDKFPSHIELPVLGNNKIVTSAPLVQRIGSASFSVFPNPANDFFVCTNNSSEPFTFEIYDLTGKKVFESELKTEHWNSVTLLKKGVYLVKFASQSKLTFETKKLIVN